MEDMNLVGRSFVGYLWCLYEAGDSEVGGCVQLLGLESAQLIKRIS